MLNISTSIEVTGSMRGELVLALLVAWVITFLCMLKGIKTSGKVSSMSSSFLYPFIPIDCLDL